MNSNWRYSRPERETRDVGKDEGFRRDVASARKRDRADEGHERSEKGAISFIRGNRSRRRTGTRTVKPWRLKRIVFSDVLRPTRQHLPGFGARDGAP